MKHDHLATPSEGVFLLGKFLLLREMFLELFMVRVSVQIVAEDRFNSPNRALCVWGIGERTWGYSDDS